MVETILILGAGLAGAAFGAWRLRGDRGLREVARAVILGGGGPGPRQPK